jgi:1-deoxy-D-xylulose-5-phosphate synthase
MPGPNLLDSLLAPADLRKLSPSELTTLAEQMRTRIKETVSTHGGHLASNLGTIELTLALHRVFDFTSDRILWDVGHQAYPHKLLTGRAKQFHTNRQAGGISGFPDPKESPFDLAKVGHSSTAISTGVGVAEGYRRQQPGNTLRRHTVVVVGDGALTGGMCFEGLINAGQLKSDLIVVLNDNGNFIDPPTGSLHTHLDRIRTGTVFTQLHERFKGALKSLPRGKYLKRLAEHLELVAHKLVSPGYIFEDLGFAYFGPVDGHDINATEEMLKRVQNLGGPILVHVHTKKGGGWDPAIADPLKFHGPKGFDIDTGAFAPVPKKGKTYSQVFADTVIDLMQEDPAVVAITAAMPSGTGLRAVGQRFPDRMYDVGICEQHSFAFAEGLAIAGLQPIIAHYSTFAQRGYDQLFQEMVVQRNLGIILTLDRGGLVGEDGETHQGLYDISYSRCFPGLALMAPKDGTELVAMLRWCHQARKQADRLAGYVIRYPKDEVPELWAPPAPIALGKAEVLRLGEGAQRPLMIWAYGACVRTAHLALQELGTEAAGVTLVNARFAKPLDQTLLAELAQSHAQVLTLEDHALPGGFGSVVNEAIGDLGLDLRVSRGGVRDELVPHASREQQLAAQGLDVPGVIAHIRRLLSGKQQAIRFTRAG